MAPSSSGLAEPAGPGLVSRRKKMREPIGSRQVYKGEIEEKLSRNIAASQQETIILYCAFYCQWLLFEKDHDVRKCRFIYGLSVCK
jgi:hypothetical protein